jgi:predicted RecA/RadA family phage recombinase
LNLKNQEGKQMRNYVQDGVVVTLTAPEALDSGEGAIVGGIFCVASGAAAAGKPFEGVTRGVFKFQKTAGVVIEEGGPAYFNGATKAVTDISAAGLFLIGSFTKAQAGGDATAQVLLHGGRVSAVP